jgi:ribose transport system ATP-binding protein
LDEVLEIAETVTVLRDGAVALDTTAAGITRTDLVEAIVGGTYLEYERDREPSGLASEEGILSIKALSGKVVADVSVEGVRPREVVGITGLVGSGFEEVPALLFGAEKAIGGTIVWKRNRLVASEMQPDRARALGFAYVPATRLGRGAVAGALVRENVSLPWLSRFFDGGWLRGARERDAVSALLQHYDVRPPDPEAVFTALSGGNQQKALLGRELTTAPGLLILVEPTHGVDVAAKSEVLRRIREYADAGGVAIVGSSEPEELAKICDRVVVLRDGRLVRVLSGHEIAPRRIVEACYA